MSIKSLLRTWFLCFSWFSFIAFWGAEKHVFHMVPFRPTSYVLKIFRCLEVSNRVRNWNNVKNNIYVRSKLLLCKLEIQIFINKLMCQISLIKAVSFVFCEFNRLASWNEGKTIILVRSKFQITKKKILVSYSRSTYVTLNMCFPNSNFEGNFSTYVFGKLFWHYGELKY